MSGKIDRRQFLSTGCLQCAGLMLCNGVLNTGSGLVKSILSDGKDVKDLIDNKHIFEVKEANYFTKLPNKKIKCNLCPRECVIDHLERGYCGNRENRDGTYYVLAYSNPCAVHIDPIEKKPFFHYLPESQALSLSTAGCNMRCKFCQNWQISQSRPEQTQNVNAPPQRITDLARDRHVPIIAYTYGEPIVYYEYMYDCTKQSRKYGIKNVMISAGYINPEPLRELIPMLDAIKIDLKAYTKQYYQNICSTTLEPVLKTLQILQEENIWYEIVYLVVPTLNDDIKNIKEMSVWIRDQLSEDVPIHFSRFYPTYMLKNLQPTPVSTLERIRKASQDVGLNYVYIGNVMGHEGENTYCPSCGRVLIRRAGYQILENHINSGKCSYCGRDIAGVWNK